MPSLAKQDLVQSFTESFINYDISSADKEYTLPSPIGLQGYRIRISWTGGTGTYSLSIIGTISGYSSWEGRGTGSLTITSDGSAWYYINEGVFDSGTFLNETGGDIEFHTNGAMCYYVAFSITTSSSTSNVYGSTSGTSYFGTELVTYPVPFLSVKYISSTIEVDAAGYYTTNTYTPTTTGVSVRLFTGAATQTATINLYVKGTWR